MTGASIVTGDRKDRLVIFGTSNILSDLFDCALANGLTPVKVVAHLPEDGDERSVPVALRVARLAPLCAPPVVVPLSAFRPVEGEHVFVNRGATIGHDTRIGAFSWIQPGSTVLEDVPANVVVAGTPAQVKKTVANPVFQPGATDAH